ncbi:MAG: Response regulator receiver domain [Pseudomonadota bacterium]
MSHTLQGSQVPTRPLNPVRSRLDPPASPGLAAAPEARRTVLWVSGEAGQAEDCGTFLQAIGFDVTPVKSVPMTPAQLGQLAPGWCVIVLDADSIGADIAKGSLRQLRRMAPQVPVILMTGEAGESDFSSTESGAPDVTLCKPLSFHHLELGLQMVMDIG